MIKTKGTLSRRSRFFICKKTLSYNKESTGGTRRVEESNPYTEKTNKR